MRPVPSQHTRVSVCVHAMRRPKKNTLIEHLRRMQAKVLIVGVPLFTGVLMRIPPLFILLTVLLLAMRFWPPNERGPPFESSSRT